MDDLADEMKTVRPALRVFEGAEGYLLIRYQKIGCHVIWDVNLGEEFRGKDSFVSEGHRTTTQMSLTYLSVVSRHLVRIALTIAALNDLNIQSFDITGAYLTAKCGKNKP